MKGFTILCFWFSLFCVFEVCLVVGGDLIPASGTLKDGAKIASSDGKFELGFFSIGGTRNRYLGIWYGFSNETIVWIANREAPLNDSSGVLEFTPNGVLQLLDSSNNVVWNSSLLTAARNPVAQLLVTGNLVVKEANDGNEDNYLWQSFDHLTDTFLPAVKFGVNLVTKTESFLRSWISSDDPSPGDSTTRMDPSGYPQIYIRKGKDIVFRSGPWNGIRFSGMPNLKPNPIYTYGFVMNDREIYYRYDLTNNSVFTRMVLSNEGILQRFTWTTRTRGWNLYLTAQMDNCDKYKTCGAYGTCNINNSPACECLKGFTPKYPRDWESGDWSSGCVMKSNMTCGDGEGFRRISSVKLPDTGKAQFNRTMDLRECELDCLSNCSCTAYATLDISNGTGCLRWYGDLIDIREYSEDGQDFFLKLPASELDTSRSSDRRRLVLFIVIPVVAMGLTFMVVCLLLHKKKKKLMREDGMSTRQIERESIDESSREKDLELPQFDFTTIATATKNFSEYNKLGEGGYGPVYKGMLKDGQEIAVKRLSKESTQGLDEFKNEVLCIAKLQHRNLVKLLGCCIQVEEKMLIYEYMPNKSLDAFIFDKKQSALLEWPTRFHIINGIARGLLYLHQDSRLRIIHRDLKASNILLDYDMNPKISDFGLARIFGGNETHANTKRVVGTYGYMSPEYAIDGLFSLKSDVFSFGVLALEIVSGKRNRGFFHPDHKHNLLGHAWRLYKEERSWEMLDESLKESSDSIMFQVLRSIHIGLLCVQQNPEDRPSTSQVVLMLSSNIALPQPKEPGFFSERNPFEQESSSSKLDSCSTNEITITMLTAR